MPKSRRAAILEITDSHLHVAGIDPAKVNDEEFSDITSHLAMLHIGSFKEESKISKWLADYVKRNPDKSFVKGDLV